MGTVEWGRTKEVKEIVNLADGKAQVCGFIGDRTESEWKGKGEEQQE